MDSHGNEDEEDNDATEHVGNGVERRDQRRAQKAAVYRPVERGGHKAISVRWAKDLLDNDAVRRNPTNPGKRRQALEDPTGEPVPDKGTKAYNEEQLVAADGPTVGLCRVGWRVIVQAVEEGDVDQVGGPDHGGRPDQEATSQAGQAISSTQRGDAKQKLECPAEILLVPQTLSQEDIGGIQYTTTIGSL